MPNRNPSHHPVKPLPGLVPWIGGKRNLASQIIPRIESVPHTCYAEPFIGMGGVFLRRPMRAPVEALNDRNGEVANVFRVLQRHAGELARALRFVVTSAAEFNRQRRVDPATLTDVERAARFIFLQACSYGGKLDGSFARHPMAFHGLDPARRIPLLRAVHHRLSKVTVDNLDFDAFLSRWDSSGTLFFVDPPYWGSEWYYGEGLFARADFQRLASALRGVKGKFIMTINDRPEVRKLFDGFTMRPVGTWYRLAGRPTAARELIVSNGR